MRSVKTVELPVRYHALARPRTINGAPVTDTPPLRRSLSLPLVTFYGIGTIVGAGIYVLVGKVAGVAGMATPLAFLLAAIIAGLSALSYAELASRHPVSAAEAVYVQDAFGWTALTRLVGLMMVVIAVISSATLLHGFVGYLRVFLPAPEATALIALALALGVIAAWGITQSVMIAGFMTLVELGGLLLILWAGRSSLGQLGLRTGELLPAFELNAWTGVALGGFLAFYAYIGFEDIVNVSEEVQDAPRNVPRAIMLALIVTTVFYLLVAATAVLAVPLETLAASDAPLALLYEHTTGQAPVVMTLISLVSVTNGVLVQFVMSSRILYGMSRRGWLPPLLGHVHPRTQTPVVATAVITALVLVFALLLPLVTLAKTTSFITLMIFALVNLSLLRIKRRGGMAPVVTVPLLVPALGFSGCLAMLAFQALQGLGVH